MKNNIATTCFYKIEAITFDKFLKLIPTFPTNEKDFVIFTTHTDYGIFGGSAQYEEKYKNKEIVSYEKRLSKLVNTNEQLKMSLLTQGIFIEKEHTSLSELAEEIGVDYVMDYGDAKYLINVGPRMWIASNPKDFSISGNKNGKKALCCLHPKRLRINKIKNKKDIKDV